MDILERSHTAARVAGLYRGQAQGQANALPTTGVMEAIFPDYNDMTEEFLLADVMARPGLTMRERSLIILATLTAVRFDPGLKGHMKWALNVGLTREEVAEAIMHISRYGGWPEGEEIFQVLDIAYPELADGSKPYALEKVWNPSGLSVREKHMITLAALISLRFSARLAALIGTVLDKNLSRDEILEIIIQVTPFAGWPVGAEALRLAHKVFSSQSK